jgi:hypothetical protein
MGQSFWKDDKFDVYQQYFLMYHWSFSMYHQYLVFYNVPFCPAAEIAPMFNQLQRQATTTKLQSFEVYFQKMD